MLNKQAISLIQHIALLHSQD